MKLDITKDEQRLLLMAMESAIKNSNDSLQAASIFLPLAAKVQAAADSEDQAVQKKPRGRKQPEPKDTKDAEE